LLICHLNGILPAVKAAMDGAGRVVIPKALRLTLGFKPGQILEARVTDGRLELEAAATPMTLKKKGKGVVAVPDAKLPPLTEEQVRETLERIRR
jgi:AbrB family looped-hinge helix DNA binding protein